MSTDDFTTAATVEAYRVYGNTGLPRIDLAVHMAEWARDYLAAREPTDAEVEAAAQNLANTVLLDPTDRQGWAEVSENRRATWRIIARAALSAAREARS